MNDKDELEKFWDLNDEKNVKLYIRDLSRFSFIPFIGSGMSAPFGYPTWSNFLSNIIDYFFEPNERQKYIHLLKKEKFLELADMLNDNLGDGVVEEQVRNEFGISRIENIHEDENYLSLFKNNLIKTFITTNFDSTIEKYIDFPEDKIFLPSNLQHCNDIVDNIRCREKCIIKLHGSANQSESIILTGKTFKAMYKQENTTVKELIDYLWSNSVLLFLGCGLKSDYLIKHFHILASSKKANWHYAILPYPNETEIIKRRRELASLKIRPIWYEKGKYEQIFTILRLIIQNHSLQNAFEDVKKRGKKPDDAEINKSTVMQKEKNLPETSLNINNGNIGTQNLLNIKYLNGNIKL